MLPVAYKKYYDELTTFIDRNRLITDPLRVLAYGTDASFYRLVPKIVIKTENEQEVARILQLASSHRLPVTFRAAGTSLSGQAISDSILVLAGETWNRRTVEENGTKIRLQPGVIGFQANLALAPYGKKIGPDPASINAAMIGGIAANNASGMCCGTSENSYKTIAGMRILLWDGSILDTRDPASKQHFRETHREFLDQVQEFGRATRDNHALADRIRHKFKMKNTTGYSLNALVDYEDPFDIIEHLMIGSEGTLGFISELTYHTVVEHPCKASSLMIFPDMETACHAVVALKTSPVAAVELMDRAGLRSVENKSGMPEWLKGLSTTATALLVETRAESPEILQKQIQAIVEALSSLATERPIEFTDIPAEYSLLWNIRKGLFPAVGAIRKMGTTVIIEDVAFPIPVLAPATLELQSLLSKYGYHEAIIFGHALEGNLHFVFTQDFGIESEVERYRMFMDEVCHMVVKKYDGALKAEHGTGRNMAPFVELEWGSEAFELMRSLKKLFDPHNLLNPGVILNDNKLAHITNLKPLPQTDPLVDKCIECGFCEPLCPSRNLTLTPRQRITSRRAISHLRITRSDTERLQAMEASYVYEGEQTCAADGLCALACPVEINTGDLTKELRRRSVSQQKRLQKTADWCAHNLSGILTGARFALKGANMLHTIIGTRAMSALTKGARSLSGNAIPLWNPYMPIGVAGPEPIRASSMSRPKVVYFPSCIAQSMGAAKGDPEQESLHVVTLRLLQKGGYDVIYPKNMSNLCCGTPWESKGFMDQANTKSTELEKALLEASNYGEYPVLCDTSPCIYRMRRVMEPRLKLYEPVEFVHDFLLDKISLQPVAETVAIHPTCSAKKMGIDGKMKTLAQRCAAKVIVPENVGCCGFAGDRGFNYPELNTAALENLKEALPSECQVGYSNSRTCEIGLSLHSGRYYKSILYLVDRCSV
ncbi:FAD-binding and (Fe-S)-binding domain-containing protein [Chrysiogenes arsenatis]|uniref:FAD-binding and (Fe-S)-binding domain-containing protein n=1 Tax=Chrysiogenes arsenatis TaxID=309797 RepID=UPI0003F93F5C|nr:FAD-binding and (Fe-S)-binding domain-containing protein [Chrysiogenes arsenatis]